jgi:hypothetical protein
MMPLAQRKIKHQVQEKKNLEGLSSSIEYNPKSKQMLHFITSKIET